MTKNKTGEIDAKYNPLALFNRIFFVPIFFYPFGVNGAIIAVGGFTPHGSNHTST